MQAKSNYVTWLISKNSSDIMRFPTWNYFYEPFIYLILFRLKLNCLSRQVEFRYGCLEAVGTQMSRNYNHASMLITSLPAERPNTANP